MPYSRKCAGPSSATENLAQGPANSRPGVGLVIIPRNTEISVHVKDNLAVIAALVLGTTSIFGAAGSLTATPIAVFIPAALQNGFVIEGLHSSYQSIVFVLMVVLAVCVDARRRRDRNESRP